MPSPESKPPSLLVVGLSLARGGTERHLVQILPRLTKRGFDVSIFLLNQRGVQAIDVERAGVKVIAPWIEIDPKRSSWTRSARLARLIVVTLQLFIVLLWRRPQIVHYFLAASYLIGAPLSLLARIRHKVMSRRSLNYYQRGRGSLAALERILHKRMDAVLGNSSAVTSQLKEEGAPSKRIGLIYNGIEPRESLTGAQRSVLRDNHGLASNALVITVVANLIPYKGHRDLLDALHKVRDQLPTDTFVLLAGRDDGHGAELRQQCDSLGLDTLVRFLGPVDDATPLLHASDLFVLPSHEEGFSNAVLEAMLAGLPTIVTDVGGNPEAVLDCVTGLVVPARDPTALAVALLRLIKNEAERQRFGEAGRKRALEEFSLSACIDQYEATYRALLQNKDLQLLESFRRHQSLEAPKESR